MSSISMSYERLTQYKDDSGQVDLATIEQVKLDYWYFFGDVCIQVDQRRIATSGGWVPVLDFGISMAMIAQDLESATQAVFEFTESSAQILFTREGEEVAITANWGDEEGKALQVSFSDFKKEAKRLLVDVLLSLTTEFPRLKLNPYIQATCELHGIKL